ncbi:MAG: alanine racemase [Sulfitobacter litoralis]|jgi:alanine racemase|uniref:Alanine racemase n=1 Tax=Sulfitobacter litoralis TaxID=335975 RepID=A0ABY0S5B6_9RHOB|nr:MULTISPECIES: alanine racemase [Sulfitobacter]MBQ0716274.1 alanine racemase [Sulfitobacter litoralis]MBQ0766350.1 alanine racemase [Sulfitobacter litoralis]MBQ0802220.1 alanine racemase [Sulfitobacter litoralis]MCF7725580.1 alanine racemase [Sulfitobacter sp. M22]MCF7776965.1 alanine racemase [Sulfitobacter sp. M220]|tara:strand:+ start:746 stop:1780 length:1035 start_codon:yes stop_codon:yes gene_type:complete
MTTATLSIDLNAVAANWQALNEMTGCETGAVIKANAYGLGIDRVAPVLAAQGARKFFVAVAEEGVALRRVLGPGPAINVFAGHMPGDADMIRSAALTPMINSVDQLIAHVETLPGHRFGIQLNSGMNRLGMDPAEWSALRDIALAQNPTLIISHLACADEPNHPMNARQLKTFHDMTDGLNVPRSLAATGGILLGRDYHFDMTRPGIGLYGGLPFMDAQPVVTLDVPVIQVREVSTGHPVGYGCAWTAPRPSQVATIAAGYADGLIRALGNGATLTHEGRRLPVIGRVSMDLITVDVTSLAEVPEHLQLIGGHQSVDTVAGFAGTIGYEVLTALGARYDRVYVE